MIELKKAANYAGERLSEGVPCALEEVVDLYQKKIYNLALRFTCDYAEAFDLSQEIFLRLHRKINLYTQNTDFNAWFMRLAVNTSINYRARLNKSPSHSAEEFQEKNKIGTNDMEPIDREGRTQLVNSLLAQLPRRERMAIILQLWENKKVKQIAELMGISVKGVESLLTRGRKRLRKMQGFLDKQLL